MSSTLSNFMVDKWSVFFFFVLNWSTYAKRQLVSFFDFFNFDHQPVPDPWVDCEERKRLYFLNNYYYQHCYYYYHYTIIIIIIIVVLTIIIT